MSITGVNSDLHKHLFISKEANRMIDIGNPQFSAEMQEKIQSPPPSVVSLLCVREFKI